MSTCVSMLNPCSIAVKASNEVGLSQFVGKAGRGQASGLAPACLEDLYVI